MLDRVSIIIPTFNSEDVIADCVQSVITQTYCEKEIIIVDGESKDSTLTILQSFSSKHSFIKVYSEKDKGIYDAMNKGVKLAKGEWIYFLGSDDRFYKNDVLAKIFSNPSMQKNDVIYGNVISKHLGGKYDGEFTENKLLEKNICHQAIFYKRNIFKKTGLFNLRYKVYSDWDHNMKWFYNTKIIACYFDEIVAEHADGGYSSSNPDHAFSNDKFINYLVYAKRCLPRKTRIELLKSECKRALLAGNNRRLLLKILLRAPMIVVGV